MNNYLDIDFPHHLSRLFTGGAEFSTAIATIKNKQEVRNQNWQNPRFKYKLMHKYCNKKLFEELKTFFLICGGCKNSFNFNDKTDNRIEKQTIAIGDGITKEFQIYKNYQYQNYNFKRNVYKVSNTKVFINDNELQSGDFYVKNGTLVFTDEKVPQSGDVIKIDTNFSVIVRFDTDFFNASQKDFGTIEMQDMSLIEVVI